MHLDEPERYVNIGHSFWSVGIGCAVIIIGGLLSLGVHWRIILGIIGILTLFSSLGFLLKENPAKRYPEVKEKINFSDILSQTKTIINKKRFWLCCLAMFFGAGAEFGLTFWSAAYIELTFQTSSFVAGLGTGAIAIGMFIGRAYFGYIAKPENLRYILVCCAGATIPITVTLALLKYCNGTLPVYLIFIVLFLLLFIAGIGISPYWPTTQVYGVQNLPDCDSTLLYVYYSAMGIPGCGFFSWLMGAVGDRFGTTGTIAVVPCCLCIFLSIIFYECWLNKDKN